MVADEVKFLMLPSKYLFHPSIQSVDGCVWCSRGIGKVSGRGGGGQCGGWCDELAPRASLTARSVLSGGGKSVSCTFGSLSSVCSLGQLARFIYLLILLSNFPEFTWLNLFGRTGPPCPGWACHSQNVLWLLPWGHTKCAFCTSCVMTQRQRPGSGSAHWGHCVFVFWTRRAFKQSHHL